LPWSAYCQAANKKKEKKEELFVRRFKRGMAALLAAVMMVTALPLTALAEEELGEPAEASEIQTAVPDENNQEEPAELQTEVSGSDGQEETEQFVPEDDQISDEVTYNTGSMAVTVGSVPAEPERMYYDQFALDGSYTIEVNEPAPFFPYEVQFEYSGKTWSEWFENPDDTVVVGGHTFRIVCSDEPTCLGFEVSGKYIPAYPEKKEFNTSQNYGAEDYDPNAGIAPASLLELEEKSVEVDFTGYLPEELTAVAMKAFLGGESVDGKSSFLWMNTGNDSYDRYAPGDYVNLSRFVSEASGSTNSNRAQIIAGTFDQMDPNNIRYLVQFRVSNLGDLLQFQAYTRGREYIGETNRASSMRDKNRNLLYYYNVYNSGSVEQLPIWETQSILANMRFNESDAWRQIEQNGVLTAEVYSGQLDAGTLASATPITEQIWDQPNMAARGGYAMNASEVGASWITVVLRHNGESHILQRSVQIASDETYSYLELGFQALQEDGTLWQVQDEFRPYTNSQDDSLHYIITIQSKDWKGTDVILRATYNERYEANGLTAAVYEGTYPSEEDALRNGAEDISEKFWGADAEGYLRDYSKETPFTVVLKKDNSPADVLKLQIQVEEKEEEQIRLDPSEELYSTDRMNKVTSQRERAENGTYFYTMRYNASTTSVNYPRDGQYYFYLRADTTYPHEEEYVNGRVDVKAAYEGEYADAAAAAGQPDIKEELFTPVDYRYEDGSQVYTGGYLVDFKNGAVSFTIIDVQGKVYHVRINTLTPLPEEELSQRLSTDTYFHITGVTNPQGEAYDQYTVSSADDSYYFNGFQTLFILNKDGSPVTDSEIIPTFSTGTAVNAYASHDEKSGIIIEKGTKEPFQTNVPIHYSAASESGTHLRNYWVTFLTQEPGAKLYVNGMNDFEHYVDGMPEREVLMGAGSSDYHDILIANVGSEKLTGLYARLEGAKNVRLDEYWTVGETAALDPFDSVKGTTHYGELNNIAKIRLHRKKDLNGEAATGVIRGVLVIGSTATGQEIKIKLTGTAGIPKITTEAVVDGVQFVPYSSVLQTNNMYKANGVEFELVSGTLPSGVRVKRNGEIYGIPQRSGDFTFTVRATYNGQTSESKTFELHIKKNDDEPVYRASDTSYELEQAVGINTESGTADNRYHYELNASDLSTDGTKTFKSKGPYIYFINFWLDGERLYAGTDYEVDEGSTILTLSDSAIRRQGNGTHTLAAEFREGDKEEGTLKRTAQNYTITGLPEPVRPSTPSDDDSSSDRKPSSSKPTTQKPTSKPTTQKPTTPSTPSAENSSTGQMPDAGFPFTDVLPSQWCYESVKWAYDNGYMQGVSPTLFGPRQPITQAAIVTVLARAAKIDLTQFADESYPGIENGKWYTQSAVWAAQSGLLPDNSNIDIGKPLTRNDMAIMLVKYMRSLGLNTTPPEQVAEFADSAQMTQEGNDAFQVLYQYNIFRGVGGGAMEPASSTTRAQFAALMKRISDFSDSQEGT